MLILLRFKFKNINEIIRLFTRDDVKRDDLKNLSRR